MAWYVFAYIVRQSRCRWFCLLPPLLMGACGFIRYDSPADALGGPGSLQPRNAGDDVVFRLDFDTPNALATPRDTLSVVRQVGEVRAAGEGASPAGLADFAGGLGHFEVAHRTAFELEQGAIETRLKLASGQASTYQTVWSKDAEGRLDGSHFSLYVLAGNRLLLRAQPVGSDNLPDLRLCSDEPLPADTWIDVRVNFGQPDVELIINGELQSGFGRSAGTPTGSGDDASGCGPIVAVSGLVNNTQPLVLGGANAESPAGTTALVRHRFRGVMDSFVIRSRRVAPLR